MPVRVRVEIGSRKFTVIFDSNGEPSHIKERKKYGTPPIDGWCDSTYWHKSWMRGRTTLRPSSLSAHIITLAKAKHAAAS